MKVLGIDYGRRRIGLAISDEGQVLARPLDTFVRTYSLKNDLAHLSRIIREQGVDLAVFGLPLHRNGAEGEMALEVSDFAHRLAAAAGIAFALFDERLTSAEAERVLRLGNVNRRKRRQLQDGLAAVLILQGFLDSQSTPGQEEQSVGEDGSATSPSPHA